MRKYVKILIVIVDVIILMLASIIVFLNQYLPSNYYVTTGGKISLPTVISASDEKDNVITVGTNVTEQLELKLLGFIPIKKVNVQQVEAPILIPGGEPFGIKLLTDGVMVVEVSSFESQNGFVSPALESGIEKGDIIKSIDNILINSNSDIEKIISSSNGKELSVNVIRNDVNFTINLKPEKCSTDGCYRAGLWVRDSSAGIGTVTFFDPDTNGFVGLGHPVCDVDTGEIMPLYSGEVVKVSINGIKKGRSGVPGELMGGFISSISIGSLDMNKKTGVYGHMDEYTSLNEAIPLAMRQEIKTGKAYIYTTINGTIPKKYEINIEKIDFSETDESKNMIIQVTDKILLEETGGIVQGMSGSPIIQNGKLIGAVTHVFVNNPAKGYAIFADTMYEQLLKAS